MLEKPKQIEYDSAKQLEADSFSSVLENVREGASWAEKELGYFEESFAQGNSFGIKEHSEICLKDFCELMRNIESLLYHPADMDKIFRDDKFREDFSRVVKGIRKNDLIGMLRDTGSKSDRDNLKGFLDLSETYLLKAEIYVADNATE
jgi:hypothetical protein